MRKKVAAYALNCPKTRRNHLAIANKKWNYTN